MLIPNQMIEIKWNNKNKDWYISKGYVFTKSYDTVLIKAEDLAKGSHKKVLVSCDYCGKIFSKTYKEYIKGKKTGKDCCNSCQKLKTAEVCMEKYGVSNVFALEEVKEQINHTNLEKYGHENIAQGVLKEKIKETNMKKYGVPYSTQAKEVIVKIRKSLQEKGCVPTSQKQLDIYNMLIQLYGEDSCTLNYPYDRLNFDCLLIVNGIKIDVEYDGWYWHKDKQEEDKRRNYFLTKRGFKILRIRSYEETPTFSQIKEAVDILVKTNKKLLYINLDIR